MQFTVADLCLSIGPDDYVAELKPLLDFSQVLGGNVDLNMTLNPVSQVEKPDGTITLVDEVHVWGQREDLSWFVFYESKKEDGTYETQITCDATPDWSVGSITYVEKPYIATRLLDHFIGQIFVKNRILFFDGLVFHASAILHNGKAILFTAPSGIGKSTQSQLWAQYKGAEIINDDCPIVRITEEGVRAYGSPWSGSSGLFQNIDAPVSSIIIVEQAVENTIEPLTLQEAVLHVLPRCFLPYHDPSLMSKAVSIAEQIVKHVPVYKLRCTPAQEAVLVTARCLYP